MYIKLSFLFLAALGGAITASAQTYYLPPGVTNIRAMVVGGTALNGGGSQIWRDFCLAQRVGLAQTITDLPAIATASAHLEIQMAPIITCGTSAGATAATTTALANLPRAVAVVGLHGVMFAQGNDGFNANRSGENGDVATLNFSAAYGLPMIHNFDNNDGFINPVVLQGLTEFGRAQGAPWTFFIHHDGNHTDNDIALTTMIFPWLAGVLDARLPANAGTGNGAVTLNPMPESNGWLGDVKTKTIAGFASYTGDKSKAIWFPNQSVASAWAGYHVAPPYNIPPQPIVAPSGIIADLTILDPANNDTASGTGWKINANFKEADQTGSLVKFFVMAPPPASVAGLDWIRPISPGKTYSAYTADPIFTFRVTADATVFIAHSDQITTKPAWLTSWTNTGEQIVNTAGNLTASAPRHTLFKKDFAANSIVTCGGNGGNGTMYFTLVKPLGAQALPSVSAQATDASATEGGDTGAFTIARTGDTTAALTVGFTVSGTATSGSDFTSLGNSVTIPAGQASTVLSVTTLQDTILESTETVVLTLASSAAYNLGSPIAATVNVLDDDSPPLPEISVADSISNAAEPSAAGQFTISRTGATTSALTVNFSVTGSATSGTDYAALGTSVVIPAGQSSVALAVTPIDDTAVEGTETVTLSIASNVTYALGTINVASVNITDNDTSAIPVVTIVATDSDAGEPGNGGSWTITRAGSITSALAVSFTTSGTAPRAQDYTLSGVSGTTLTIPANQTSATILLNVVNDTVVESIETAICTIAANAAYTLGSPASATINIADDDSSTTTQTVTVSASDANAAEPNDGGAWTLTRSGTTTAALTINFTTSGTATRTTDYTVDAPPTGTTLTFPANQATLVVPLTVVDDTELESSETAIFTIGTGSGYSVGSPSSATVNLADNDTPATGPGVVTLSSTDLIASEAAGNTASIVFTRTGATTNALPLSLRISGDATNGTDAATVPTSLVIDAGQSTATLTITPTDDSLIEGAETLAVSLLPGANYTLGSVTTLGAIITDNENAAPLTDIGITFVTRVNGANTRETKLNVYRPASGSGPWPVILFYPGGGWTSQNEGSISQFFINLTAHGYAVVSANYVTSSFAKWPAQIQDAKAAVRWVRANAATYGFDTTRIGVTGGSSGGHISTYVAVSGGLKTARCGSEIVDLVGTVGGNFSQSDIVHCAAPYFPPTDLLVMDHYPTPDVPDHNGSSPETGLIGFNIQTVPEKTGTANPITLVRPGLPPFMLFHGTADRSVNFNQSELMNGALVQAAQPVTFWPVQGGGHGIGVSDNQEIAALTKAFFDRQLKGSTTNALPVASFTATTLTGTAPLTVTFNGTASSDRDGVITRYSWATGDDEGAGSSVMTYTYTTPGIYPVCLAVRDDRGATHSTTANVIVNPAGTASATPPTISITGPAEGFLYARTGDLSLQTNATSQPGTPLSSVEFFLNGQPIAFDNKSPYNTTLGSLPPGRYTAQARASDSTGAATTSAPITFVVTGEQDLFPEPSLTGNQLSLDYHRFTDGSLTYTFERSPNLLDWTPFTPTESILSNGPQVQERRAIDPLSTSGVDRRFLRIRVQRAP
jgi:acetyl esterase/lipase